MGLVKKCGLLYYINWGLAGSLLKVFTSLFSKSDRRSNARAVVAVRRRRNSFSGVSFLPSFFLCADGVKEKSGIDVSKSIVG